MRINLLCSLVLALLFGVCPSYAQADLNADVPFDFHAGKRILPAGEYTFEVDNSGLIWVRGEQKGARSVVHSFGVGGGDFDHESKIVFRRYGENYFLSELWSGASMTGRQINRTPDEEELARNMNVKPVSLRASVR